MSEIVAVEGAGWETVVRENDGSETARLRVPGGWLYRVMWQFWGQTSAGETAPHAAVAIQFVPDGRLVEVP